MGQGSGHAAGLLMLSMSPFASVSLFPRLGNRDWVLGGCLVLIEWFVSQHSPPHKRKNYRQGTVSC